MVAPPVVLVAAVLLDQHGAVRVILNHYPVRVRHALVVLVDEGVLILIALVSRHKLDRLLLVAWKNGKIAPGNDQLVELRNELGRLG